MAALGAVAMALAGAAHAGEPTPMGECLSALSSQTEFAPLRSKIALGGVDEQTFGMMASKGVPNKKEVELIVRWIDGRSACIKLMTEKTPMRPSFERVHSGLQRLALDLIDGKITFGQFARARSDAIDAEVATYTREFEQAAQAAERQREQAAQAAQREREQAAQAAQQEREQAAQAAERERARAAQIAYNEQAKKARECQDIRQHYQAMCGTPQNVVVNIGSGGMVSSNSSNDIMRAGTCAGLNVQVAFACSR